MALVRNDNKDIPVLTVATCFRVEGPMRDVEQVDGTFVKELSVHRILAAHDGVNMHISCDDYGVNGRRPAQGAAIDKVMADNAKKMTGVKAVELKAERPAWSA